MTRRKRWAGPLRFSLLTAIDGGHLCAIANAALTAASSIDYTRISWRPLLCLAFLAVCFTRIAQQMVSEIWKAMRRNPPAATVPAPSLEPTYHNYAKIELVENNSEDHSNVIQLKQRGIINNYGTINFTVINVPSQRCSASNGPKSGANDNRPKSLNDGPPDAA